MSHAATPAGSCLPEHQHARGTRGCQTLLVPTPPLITAVAASLRRAGFPRAGHLAPTRPSYVLPVSASSFEVGSDGRRVYRRVGRTRREARFYVGSGVRHGGGDQGR